MNAESSLEGFAAVLAHGFNDEQMNQFHQLFVTVPCLFSIVTSMFIHRSTKTPTSIGGQNSVSFTLKMTACYILLIMQLADLHLSRGSDEELRILTQFFMCVETACIAALLYIQYNYKHTPPAFLSIYLAFSITFCGAASFLDLDIRCLSMMATWTEFLLKASILYLYERPGSILESAQGQYTGQSSHGWWTEQFSLWLLPMANSAAQDRFSISDVQRLPTDQLTQKLADEFHMIWTRNRSKRIPLVRTCLQAQNAVILQAVVFRFLHSMIKLAFVTLFLHFLHFIDFANESNLATESRAFATRLSTLTFGLLFLSMPVLNAMAITSTDTAKLRLRAMLTSAVFRHLYVLSDDNVSKSASHSLITSDIATVSDSINDCVVAFISVVDIIAFSAITWTLLGSATLFFLFFLGTILFSCYLLIGSSKGLSVDARHKTATRRIATQDMLNNIKSIKLTNSETAIKHSITQLRNDELTSIDLFGWGWSIPCCLAGTADLFLPCLLFFTTLGQTTTGGTPAAIAFVILLEFLAMSFRILNHLPSTFILAFRSLKHLETQLHLHMDEDDALLKTRRKATHVAKQKAGQAIQLRRATIAPSFAVEAVLFNVNLEIKSRTLTIITGEIAAGKTTLIRSLLNRCPVLIGSVAVIETPVAYCGQEAWILNTTLRANIIGPLAYDATWYQQVLNACCLREDIIRLPDRDDELVGHHGCKLNHSQRYRVALARAVYAKPKVLLLDDIFSTQSATIAESLVIRLLSRDCFLRQITTIVATSRTADLFIRHADGFVNINDNGIVRRYTPQVAPEEDGSIEHVDQINEKSMSQDSERVDTLCRNIAHQIHDNTTLPQTPHKSPRYFFLLQKMNRREAYLCLAMLIQLLCIERLPYSGIQIWLESEDRCSLPYKTCAVAMLASEVLFASCTKLFQTCVTNPIQVQLHEELVEAVLYAPMEILTVDTITEASNLLLEGVQIVDMELFINFFLTCYGALNLATVFLFTAWQHPACILGLPIVSTIIYSAHTKLYALDVELKSLALASSSALYSAFSEVILGAAHLHTFRWEDYHWYRVQGAIDEEQTIHQSTLALNKLMRIIRELIVALMAISATALMASSQSSPSQAGFILVQVIMVGSFITDMLQGGIKIGNCVDVLEKATQLVKHLRRSGIQGQTVLPQRWPRQGVVEFRNVRILPDSLNLRVNNMTISHRAEAGIVGNPGSGKTAVLMAILNMVPYEGSILIDGIEARDVPPDRRNWAFTVIPQLPVSLPFGTIRQNLVPDEVCFGYDRIDNMDAFEQMLYSLGLLKAVERSGGLHAKFSNLRLTPAQLQRFALTQALMKYFFNPSRFLLNNNAMNHVDAETLDLMDIVSRDTCRLTSTTLIQTSSNMQAVERGTSLAVVAAGEVRQADWFPANG